MFLPKVLFFAVLFGFLPLASNASENDSDKTLERIDFQGRKFIYMLKAIHSYYPDSVDIDELCTKTFKFMARELDKHSAYYSSDERNRKKDKDEGEAIGIGVNAVSLSDTITIIYVIQDSPADSAGLIPGDKIISIDGRSTAGFSQQQALDLLKGELGSIVRLQVKRGYEPDLKDMPINRNRYSLSSVSASFMIPSTDIGFINFNRFSKASDEEFILTINQLKSEGMKKLILDLRGNPGGYLGVATRMADQFISGGKMISNTKAKSDDFSFEYKSTDSSICIDVPLVILINSGSASASEAIAGAIQDLDRGLIVGERSYGKGSAQKVWDMTDGSAFKMTIAKYMTPSGRCIEKDNISSEINFDEGLTDETTVEKIKAAMISMGGINRLPVYKTEKGRTVIGGGGIIPDYIVHPDSTTKLSEVLISRGILFEFVYSILYNERDNIIRKFDNSLGNFVLNFKVDDTTLLNLKKFSISKKIWNDDMFSHDMEYIRHVIKATIAEAIWKKNGYKAVMNNYDNYVNKAMDVMPAAMKMIN